MIEETDVIQEGFDGARAVVADDGFSNKVITRLAFRQRLRRCVLIGAAMIGIVLFSSELVGGGYLLSSLLTAAKLEFATLSLSSLLRSGQIYPLVLFVVVVGVVSSTTIALIESVSNARR